MWRRPSPVHITDIQTNDYTDDGVQDVPRTHCEGEGASPEPQVPTAQWQDRRVTSVTICSKFSMNHLAIHIGFPQKRGNVTVMPTEGTGSHANWCQPQRFGSGPRLCPSLLSPATATAMPVPDQEASCEAPGSEDQGQDEATPPREALQRGQPLPLWRSWHRISGAQQGPIPLRPVVRDTAAQWELWGLSGVGTDSVTKRSYD